MTDDTTPSVRDESMGGLAKGLAVIECFNRDHPRLTVSEAARLTDLTPAAARRCMRTLEQIGYLSYDGKYYRPTPRFARLADAFTLTDPLPTLAAPLLDELREQLNETASLSVLDGDQVLFIGRSEAQHLVATGLHVGSRLPATRTAAGRVLLAGLPSADADRLASEVTAQVQAARDVGYALTDQEYELGLRAIAVPVLNGDGRCVAAMSVSVVSARATVDRMIEEFLPALQERAVRLTKTL
jgi:IclR family pca regulon transcriptional regulator